jgi:hypothetical protein
MKNPPSGGWWFMCGIIRNMSSLEPSLKQLIERSRALLRQSEKLKQEQEKLLADLEELHGRTRTIRRPAASKKGD